MIRLIGAFIKKGPINWQIIQQVDGCADIDLEGSYVTRGNPKECRVYVRIVREESSEEVIGWQPCEIVEGDLERGIWRGTIRNVPAGGLYRMEICLNQDQCVMKKSERGEMVHHFGVGDIYVIAGQSNSSGRGIDAFYDPPELGVHVYRNNGKWDLASHPLHDWTGTIHEVNSDNANAGHSPYLYFAKKLKRELGYPIGLIQSAK